MNETQPSTNQHPMRVHKKPKLSILVEADQLVDIEDAVALRAHQMGFSTKPKTSTILREVLVAWARQEKERAAKGSPHALRRQSTKTKRPLSRAF